MPDELPIAITWGEHHRWTTLSVVGDLDMATAPHLVQATAAADSYLAIDLSGVGFIDSSGLRALFQITQQADRVALVSPSAVVRRLLRLTDMDQVFVTVAELAALPDPP